MADNITIKCSECGHLNEPERVYCHNCGAKLDRSLLPKPADKKESTKQAQKRYSKMVNPRTNPLGRQIGTFIKVLLGAAVVASLALMCMPPEGAPEKGEDIGNFTFRDAWAAQSQAPGATAGAYTEVQINEYLKTLKPDDSFVKFKAAYVKLTPGVLTIWVRREVSGFSLWSSAGYQPTVKDGKLGGIPVSIHYGRLGIAPELTFAHSWGTGAVLTAIAPQFKDLDRIQEITVGDGVLNVVTKPK